MRKIKVAAAQIGPVERSDAPLKIVSRLNDLLREAASDQVNYVVFTECTTVPFFPHWLATDEELDSYFHAGMPDTRLQPLFDTARELGIAFNLGYPEKTPDGRFFNSSILVDTSGEIVLKYRKVHLPGYREPSDSQPFQNLEKRYFEVGDLGFPVVAVPGLGNARMGLAICNDRRWPEVYRVMGLQGVEVISLGYNTPVHYPNMEPVDHLTAFHNQIVMQANAYSNGTWVIAAARGGTEEGVTQLADSCIIAPSGEIVAKSTTLEDELVSASIDLDFCQVFKKYMFNMRAHRRPEYYGLITAPVEETWDSGPLW